VHLHYSILKGLLLCFLFLLIHLCLREEKNLIFFLSKKNGVIIMNTHEVYVSIIQIIDYLLPIINVVLLKRRSNLLIRPPFLSLISQISQISLSNLGRVPFEVWISDLRGWLIFPGWIPVRDG
jgi:hypothetical protein